MKNQSTPTPCLMNDRQTWLLVAAIISGCGVASSASAQLVITDSTSAPTANILTSQLTDLGPGPQDNNRDYMNNGGTVGQTFSVGANSVLDDITIKGRGDSAQYYSGGPQPFTAGTIWSIQIASVNPTTGALTPLDVEQSTTYVPTGGGADDTSYLTYALANPVTLTAGQEYAFNLYVNDGTVGESWFGLAHSSSANYAGGTAENSNTSLTSGTGPVNAYGAYAEPNPGNYSYVFAAEGLPVPEPGTLAMLGLGSAGLMAALRRRRRA